MSLTSNEILKLINSIEILNCGFSTLEERAYVYIKQLIFSNISCIILINIVLERGYLYVKYSIHTNFIN